MDMEKVIERIHEAVNMGVCVDSFMDVLELLKEQKNSIPISWFEQYTRLKCSESWHNMALAIIETWKTVNKIQMQTTAQKMRWMGIEERSVKSMSDIRQEDIAEILNKINDALEGTGYVAVGFENTKGFLCVLVDKE